jgi:hypothetical protein
MFDPFKFAWNAILDRSSKELLSAVMVATALALMMTCIYVVGRRKLRDNATLATVLFLLTSLASMALAAGYVENSPFTDQELSSNVYRGPLDRESDHLFAPAVQLSDP